MDNDVRKTIERFLENNALFEELETLAGDLVNPPEYQAYCKLCHASIEDEHIESCLFYPLMMAL